MQRDAGGCRNVQRIDRGGNWNARTDVCLCFCGWCQSWAFASNDQRYALRPRARCKIARVFARRQCDDREPFAFDHVEIVRPVACPRVRSSQYGSHRCSNRLSVQRVAAGIGQHHARTKCSRVAKRAADIVCVSDTLEDEHEMGLAQNIAQSPARGPFGERQAPTVQMEARNCRKPIRFTNVDRHVGRNTRERRLKRVERRIVHENRIDTMSGC